MFSPNVVSFGLGSSSSPSSNVLRSIRQRLLAGCRVCRLNRTTTGDIKIMKCAGVVDSLLARSTVYSLQSTVLGLRSSVCSSLQSLADLCPNFQTESQTDWPIGATVDCRRLSDVCRLPSRV